MKKHGSKNGIFYAAGQELPLPERYSPADKKSSDSLECGKNRLVILMFLFFVAFGFIGVRLIDVTIVRGGVSLVARAKADDEALSPLKIKMMRADIVDRNDIVLATSLPSADLYVDAEKVKNPETVAAALAQTLPDMKYDQLLTKLKSEKNFVYLRRKLTPKEQYDVNRLGFPQLNFQKTEVRVYPQGALMSHLIGVTNIDNRGIAGVEKSFDESLSGKNETVRLSLDVGVQDTVRTALKESIDKFRATGGAAILMNAKTGEIVSMVSLPDYDPNDLNNAKAVDLFNQASLGVYEVGSVMKLFTIATGLETNKITVKDTIDATRPLMLANHTINDVEKLRRVVTVPEILIESSNIGAATVALKIGGEKQRDFFNRFGFFKTAGLELPEHGRPLLPQKWRDVTTATAGYGYGVALTPVHIVAATAALVNGGIYNTPSLLAKRPSDEKIGKRVISKKTSDIMRGIMRQVVISGSGRKANVPGFEVGGKTGSAQKLVNGKYVKNTLRTSFVSAFPMDNPQYVLMVMLDAPKGLKETHYFNTAGWNAAPTAGKIIEAIAPQLGIAPRPFANDSPAPYVNSAINAR